MALPHCYELESNHLACLGLNLSIFITGYQTELISKFPSRSDIDLEHITQTLGKLIKKIKCLIKLEFEAICTK